MQGIQRKRQKIDLLKKDINLFLMGVMAMSTTDCKRRRLPPIQSFGETAATAGLCLNPFPFGSFYPIRLVPTSFMATRRPNERTIVRIDAFAC